LNNFFYKISRCEKISKNNLIYLKNKEETGITGKGKNKLPICPVGPRPNKPP
jgi:hypothetical protein